MKNLFTKIKLTRMTAVLLVVITVFSMIFALPVSAVGDEVTIIFDYCYDSNGNTIKFQQETTNDGYTVGVAGEELCKIFADDEEAYCIEPGHSLFSYDTLKKDATTVWKDLGSAKQKAINLALLYGKPGSSSSLSGNDDEKWVATQLIVWEFVADCRETKNGFKCTNTKFIDGITAGGANSGVKKVYNEISNSLANYSKVPSFASAVLSKAETYELKANGNSYELTLTDNNNILSKFDFKSTGGVTVSKSGNKLTLKSSLPITEEATFNCAKTMPDVDKAVLVPYGDASMQDIITGVENDNDPVRAYFKIKTSQGNLKIVKTSEDGKVANVKFKITGDNYSEEVTTNTNGEFEIKNLKVGTYTITEIVSDEYEAQKSQTVTVENGKATFTTDIPFGKYYVQEYTTDEHYVLDDTKYEFEFSYTDENTSVQIIEVNNGKPIVNKPITGGLEITKKDISTGELLPNAGFRIKDENGNIVVEGYTNEKGVVKFTLGYGKYTYEEFDAPDGYIIDTTPHEFEIKENGQIIKSEMTNKKQPEPDKPQTGDSSNIGFFIGLGAFAVGGLVAFIIIRFRKKDEDED